MIGVALSVAYVIEDVVAFDVPQVVHGVAENLFARPLQKAQNADVIDLVFLRLCARRERPRCRATECSDERAPFHSITSSAHRR